MLSNVLLLLTQGLALTLALPAPAESPDSTGVSESDTIDSITSTLTEIPASADSASITDGSKSSSSIHTVFSTSSPVSTQGSATSFDSSEIESFYSSVGYNVVSFYADFLSSRSNFVHGNQKYFNTHTFEFGTYSSVVSEITTYTDDSFTTMLAASPELYTVLASVATEFPWHSNYVKDSPFTGLANPTSNSAADSSYMGGPIAKASMNTALMCFVGITALFAFSLF